MALFILTLVFNFCSEDHKNLTALEDMMNPEGNSTETQFQPNPVLYQNYPNPFNPSTIIEFEIPATLHVRLKVLTIEWEEVETLIDRVLSAGFYRSYFYSKDLPSGEYYYILEAGGTKLIGKMKCVK